MTEPLRLAPQADSRELVSLLEGLLEDARSGKLVSVTVLEELTGGTYRVTGNPTTNRGAHASRLMEAAMARMGVAFVDPPNPGCAV